MPLPVLPAAMAVKAMASINSAAAAANQTSSYANLAAQNVDLAIDQFNNAMANWESYIYGTPVSSIPAATRRSPIGQAPLAIIPDQVAVSGIGEIGLAGFAAVHGSTTMMLTEANKVIDGTGSRFICDERKVGLRASCGIKPAIRRQERNSRGSVRMTERRVFSKYTRGAECIGGVKTDGSCGLNFL
ncbi:unnamed protein product [Amoebophrya sp. A120]|nr:unnamed protein product [Amoebophrya sp. A120]|eukprot:GSA120T00002651001.1